MAVEILRSLEQVFTCSYERESDKFNVQKDNEEEDTSSLFCVWNMFCSTKRQQSPFYQQPLWKVFTPLWSLWIRICQQTHGCVKV